MKAGIAAVASALLSVCANSSAHADIWSREDSATGLLYFTNLRPTHQKGWKRYTTGPGKAGTVSGVVGDCKRSGGRAVVPARDRSKERYTRYDLDIRDAASVYRIPEALIRAVIKVESDFDPNVVSCAGAQGLMQLMPGTQKMVGVENVWDQRQSVFGGTAYLRRMANHFDGDLAKTIAGYHAGPGAVIRYRGVPPYETTRLYVHMVRKEYDRQKTRVASATLAPTLAPVAGGSAR